MDEGRIEPERLVATLRGRDSPTAPQLAAAVDRWRRPPRIQVAGRARAGKTTVQRALALISAEETAPVDEPGRDAPLLDADLVLYVLGGTLYPADCAALGAAAQRTLVAECGAASADTRSDEHEDRRAVRSVDIPVDTRSADRILLVLNKADAIGTRWSDAVAAADRYAAETGLSTFPVMATLAANTRSGILTGADLAVLRRHTEQSDPAFTLAEERFTSPAFGPDTAERATLIDRWTLPGIAYAHTALRHQPELPPRRLLQILHAASGIDPLHHELHRRYEQLTVTRNAEFLDALAYLAARADSDAPLRADSGPDHLLSDRDLIERYLHGAEERSPADRPPAAAPHRAAMTAASGNG
ncbi:hypothetical protein [Nocardia uniformis]|uniref:hypothetical protein n=1 Tax=Nocardia uniformis TaxID=53432 RepID=UPI0008352427|nr:hypothetical protein [Nocardia uniformis]